MVTLYSAMWLLLLTWLTAIIQPSEIAAILVHLLYNHALVDSVTLLKSTLKIHNSLHRAHVC